jgi:hypothetical protein
MKVLFASGHFSDTGESWGNAAVQGLANFAHDFYLTTSYGKVALDITVTPTFNLAMTKAQALGWQPMYALQAECSKIGINPATFARCVYLYDAPTAPAPPTKGVASGGNCIIFNCMSSDYSFHSVIHELGHTFGLGHPAVIPCGTRNGNVVTLPPLTQIDGINFSTLYDASTPMGYEAYNFGFDAYEKYSMGWITPTVYAGGDVTYTLTPLEQAGGSVYCVRIPCSVYLASSHRQYWIEYRGTDVTLPRIQGLLVRMTGDFGMPTAGLINYGPAQTDAIGSVALLQVGDMWTDGTIAMTCTGPGTVRVRHADAVVMPPPSPNAGTIASAKAKLADLSNLVGALQ